MIELVDGARSDDQSVNVTFRQQLDRRALLVYVLVAVGEDELEAGCPRLVGNAPHEPREELILDVGDHDADRLGQPGSHAAGQPVGAISDLFGSAQDALAQRWTP